jgi:small subunit ribosomal protein S18
MAIQSIQSEGNTGRSERGPKEDREEKDGDDRMGRRGGFHRKKVCRFCSDQDFIMDYKDSRMMQSFVTEHGKIVPRRISGNCAMHQRKLTSSVKRARNLALVGYVSMGT